MFLFGFLFAARRTREPKEDKDSKDGFGLGVTFKYHTLLKFLSKMTFLFS